jgi:drug/metabolite transporter (DMT)-like permease
VLAAPFVLPVVLVGVLRLGLDAGPTAWLGFAYVSVFSMFLGFFAWYRGLAVGGVARVSQLQLLQPLLTLAWSVALLRTRVGHARPLGAGGRRINPERKGARVDVGGA